MHGEVHFFIRAHVITLFISPEDILLPVQSRWFVSWKGNKSSPDSTYSVLGMLESRMGERPSWIAPMTSFTMLVFRAGSPWSTFSRNPGIEAR